MPAMAEGLPQLLVQLSSWLKAEDDAGRVGCDGGQDASGQVQAVRTRISDAMAAGYEVAACLQEAHNAAADLTLRVAGSLPDH